MLGCTLQFTFKTAPLYSDYQPLSRDVRKSYCDLRSFHLFWWFCSRFVLFRCFKKRLYLQPMPSRAPTTLQLSTMATMPQLQLCTMPTTATHTTTTTTTTLTTTIKLQLPIYYHPPVPFTSHAIGVLFFCMKFALFPLFLFIAPIFLINKPLRRLL